jgi:phosphatidate cytidylyltransferase
MLAQRIATAVALLAVLVSAMALGHNAFSVAAAVLVGVAVFEWLRLAGHPPRVAALLAAVVMAALWFAQKAGVSVPIKMLLAGVALSAWSAVAIVLLAVEHGTMVRIGRMTSTVLCLMLISAAWFALMDFSRAGAVVMVSALAVVWVADIAAYFCGRAFGRRKLAPRISPGKTWAGVVGAVAAVVAIAEAMAWLKPQFPLFTTTMVARVSIMVGVLLICALVVMSIVGDLFESLLKRQVGAKDSGRLLPGHGGVLDRIDALLPVLPAAQLMHFWMR